MVEQQQRPAEDASYAYVTKGAPINTRAEAAKRKPVTTRAEALAALRVFNAEKVYIDRFFVQDTRHIFQAFDAALSQVVAKDDVMADTKLVVELVK